MTSIRFDADTASLAHSIGVAHFGLLAVVNAACGVALLVGGVSNRLLRITLEIGMRYLSEPTLLTWWPHIEWLVTDGAILASVFLLLFTVVCLYAARLAANRHRRCTYLIIGCGAGLNPLTLPLAFVAVTLIVLSKSERQAASSRGDLP